MRERQVRIDASLPVFYIEDFPNMATHCSQKDCGYSYYRGVIIQWDEDRDTRVISVIDGLDNDTRNALFLIQEHEGGVGLMWKYEPPGGSEQYNQSGFSPDDDDWCVHSNVVLSSLCDII